jgi:hypothetical protein
VRRGCQPHRAKRDCGSKEGFDGEKAFHGSSLVDEAYGATASMNEA